MEMAVNELMSMGEVAEALNLTREGVRLCVNRGELPCVVTRGGKIFQRAVVEKYALEGRRRPGRPAKNTAAAVASLGALLNSSDDWLLQAWSCFGDEIDGRFPVGVKDRLLAARMVLKGHRFKE